MELGDGIIRYKNNPVWRNYFYQFCIYKARNIGFIVLISVNDGPDGFSTTRLIINVI